MRYLKFFESSETGYFEIEYEEYRDMSTIECFSKLDIEMIRRLDPDRKFFSSGEREDTELISFYFEKGDDPFQPYRYRGEIYKYDDEWFTVRIRGGNMTQNKVDHIWKCDQIEGLVRLLSDIFNKKLKL